MPNAQPAKFQGFGVIYPDGVTGMRVVRTYNAGPKKIHHPDGSISYTVPTPTIHELYGGGYVYASGQVVNRRSDLEAMPDGKMKTDALEWFDKKGGQISEKATKDVPNLDLEHRKRPEPVYVVSSDVSKLTPVDNDALTKELDEKVKVADEHDRKIDQILTAVTKLTETVKGQGKDIDNLKLNVSPLKVNRLKHAEEMKKKWHDPEYKARLSAKLKEAAARRKEKLSGDKPPETNQEV